ncbi:hypothetical protein B0H17DRAFT_1150247 [Mycena rosella]|uniref:Uncharacterized protein n=1 Tax=Mycena rosella TaxID=1033263 RepID=A0AAD7BWI0_MYCRO|nr:hypothetical protein B0H17DRAFT_1150247 [Mycena rosella]
MSGLRTHDQDGCNEAVKRCIYDLLPSASSPRFAPPCPAARDSTAPDPHQDPAHRLHALPICSNEMPTGRANARGPTPRRTPARMHPCPISIGIVHMDRADRGHARNDVRKGDGRDGEVVQHGKRDVAAEQRRYSECFVAEDADPDGEKKILRHAGAYGRVRAHDWMRAAAGREEGESPNEERRAGHEPDADPLAATDKGLAEMKMRVSGDPTRTSFEWWHAGEECMPYIGRSSNERKEECWPKEAPESSARRTSANPGTRCRQRFGQVEFETHARFERKKKADQWRCLYVARPTFGITSVRLPSRRFLSEPRLVRNVARSREIMPYLNRSTTGTLAQLPWRPPALKLLLHITTDIWITDRRSTAATTSDLDWTEALL